MEGHTVGGQHVSTNVQLFTPPNPVALPGYQVAWAAPSEDPDFLIPPNMNYDQD